MRMATILRLVAGNVGTTNKKRKEKNIPSVLVILIGMMLMTLLAMVQQQQQEQQQRLYVGDMHYLSCFQHKKQQDRFAPSLLNETQQQPPSSTTTLAPPPPPRKQLIHETTTTMMPPRRRRHQLFVLVGAVRTLDHTAEALTYNLLHRLCPPDQCQAHLVTHLSLSDNRPSLWDDDPAGRVVVVSMEEQDTAKNSSTRTSHHEQVTAARYFQPSDYLQLHVVQPGYDTGSPEERAAMDVVQREWREQEQIRAAHRLQQWRVGDPRRFSMWFARYWAWRYVKQELLPRYDFDDLIAFLRPDLFWYWPSPTYEWFLQQQQQQSIQSGNNHTETLFVQDSYYGELPDTFAFLPNAQVAEKYFSLSLLLDPGVACLGGPNFDDILVAKRLVQQGLLTLNSSILEQLQQELEDIILEGDPWCNSFYSGFSEQILKRKMRQAGVTPHFVSAGVALWRNQPKDKVLDCQPMFMFLHKAVGMSHEQNWAAPLACVAARRWILSTKHQVYHYHTMQDEILPYQLINRANPDLCLTRYNETFMAQEPCRMPYQKEQIFVGHGFSLLVPSSEDLGSASHLRALTPAKNFLLSESMMYDMFRERPCELYSGEVLRPRKG